MSRASSYVVTNGFVQEEGLLGYYNFVGRYERKNSVLTRTEEEIQELAKDRKEKCDEILKKIKGQSKNIPPFSEILVEKVNMRDLYLSQYLGGPEVHIYMKDACHKLGWNFEARKRRIDCSDVCTIEAEDCLGFHYFYDLYIWPTDRTYLHGALTGTRIGGIIGSFWTATFGTQGSTHED